ncbi:MAG: AraC family transcriptional regulator [Clostridia bacterium]|nr:AraC family transcriptional regulator [Clostridia bacterium]
MLYQKILSNERPYYIGIGHMSPFQEHRHADFELNFCVEGSFDILADKKRFTVEAGCTTLIPPMCSHEIPATEDNERVAMTITVGMSLLKRHFSDFSRMGTEPQVFDLRKSEYQHIYPLFMECAQVLTEGHALSDLLIKGNILKIFAYLFDSPKVAPQDSVGSAEYLKIENVEKALELIYYNYKEALSVERVAALTGYSKSNFCKIFKKVVGESFHQALNRQRASNAAGLLRATDMAVADIAAEVGFSESKAFCRVFKAIYGITPGQYRRAKGTKEV